MHGGPATPEDARLVSPPSPPSNAAVTPFQAAKSASSLAHPRKRDPRNNVNRPVASRLTQQNLRMWEPMLTLNWTIGICLFVVISCALLGVVITQQSSQLTTYRVVYDAGSDDSTALLAQQTDGEVQDLPNCMLHAREMADSFHANHTCYISIKLRAPLDESARLYYELSGYYQHHRRFVSSMDRSQFTNEWHPSKNVLACEPMDSIESESCDVGVCSAKKTRALFPCGIVASTMFNDIFWLHEATLPSGEILRRPGLIHKGMARTLPTHVNANPTWDLPLDEYLPVWRHPSMSRIIPPPPPGDRRPYGTEDYTNSTSWVVDPLDSIAGLGLGLESEHWRVWIDTAAIQPFRKAYARLPRAFPENTTLVFAVQSNFFVRSFGGTKALVLGEVTWFGSANYAMGGCFLGIAGVFALFLIFFVVRRCRNPRVLGDARALAWKHERQAAKKAQ